MKGCLALLVLLISLSGAALAPGENGPAEQRQSDAEPGFLLEPDLWGELMELRDMVHRLGATVVLQSGTLSNTETRLAISEERLATSEEEAKNHGVLITEMAAKLSASERSVKDLQARLSTSESHLAEFQTRLTTSEGQVKVLQTRLSASESQVEGFENRLSASESLVEGFETRLSASESQVEGFETRLSASESQVEGFETRLSASESRTEGFETRLSASESRTEGFETRLNASESQVEGFETRLNASESQVEGFETRLNASESQIEGFETRLNTSDVQVEDLKEESKAHLAQLTTIETRLTSAESQVYQLWNKPNVAFSVGLSDGYHGPYDSDTTLVYKKVFTNIGNAYNTSTGLVSAPVKGLYHFTYAAHDYGSTEQFCIHMYKNEERLLGHCGLNSGRNEQISSGMMVELEEGDTVDMRLDAGDRLWDSHYNHNVFNGVLLYSM